jgi:hypothetical protein
MAFALLIIGITLIVASVRNTHMQLLGLIKSDFTGPGNFVYWVAALLVIGSIGYVEKLKPVSDGFLVLVILVLFLKRGNPYDQNGGFFEKFTAALGTTTKATGSTGNVVGSIPPINITL